MTLTVGSLFSGIGGFEIGLIAAGFTVSWQAEIDSYASNILRHHFPGVPNHGDVRSISARTVSGVDVLCGGFPCQDLSIANPGGTGLDGARSGLWSEYARLIGELRPRYVIVENVPALLAHRGLSRVCGDLARHGYDAEWRLIRASDVGACHQRRRLFLVAYPAGQRFGDRIALQPRIFTKDLVETALESEDQQRTRWRVLWTPERGSSGRVWATPELSLLRDTDGVPTGLADGLRGLGNAIIPEIARLIGRAILRAEGQG